MNNYLFKTVAINSEPKKRKLIFFGKAKEATKEFIKFQEVKKSNLLPAEVIDFIETSFDTERSLFNFHSFDRWLKNTGYHTALNKLLEF